MSSRIFVAAGADALTRTGKTTKFGVFSTATKEPMDLITLVVDDEDCGRATLVDMLRCFCADTVGCIADAAGVADAHRYIAASPPDLVFLDIEFETGTGFDLLDALPQQRPFDVVVVSGHEQYGVRAARYGVLDYLLKPVDPDELVAAVLKAQQAKERRRVLEAALRCGIGAAPDTLRLHLPDMRGGTVVVAVDEVAVCRSQRLYSELCAADGRLLAIARAVHSYEPHLRAAGFLRVSRSALVNPRHVQRYGGGASGAFVEVAGWGVVPIARRRRRDILSRLRLLGKLYADE